MASCTKHPFDQAAGSCRACREEFCPDCLVYVHGVEKPPLCIPCALVAAGLRRKKAAPRRGLFSR